MLHCGKNLSTFCPFSKTLWEAKLNGDQLINLSEEIPRQPKIQAVVWVLLAAFS
jgi:hypothetical protein